MDPHVAEAQTPAPDGCQLLRGNWWRGLREDLPAQRRGTFFFFKGYINQNWKGLEGRCEIFLVFFFKSYVFYP